MQRLVRKYKICEGCKGVRSVQRDEKDVKDDGKTAKIVFASLASLTPVVPLTPFTPLAPLPDIFTARIRSTREGTVFTGVCLSTSRGWEGLPTFQVEGYPPSQVWMGGYLPWQGDTYLGGVYLPWWGYLPWHINGKVGTLPT